LLSKTRLPRKVQIKVNWSPVLFSNLMAAQRRDLLALAFERVFVCASVSVAYLCSANGNQGVFFCVCLCPLTKKNDRAFGDYLAFPDEEGGMRVGIVVDVEKDLSSFQADKSADGSTTIYRLSITSVGALGKQHKRPFVQFIDARTNDREAHALRSSRSNAKQVQCLGRIYSHGYVWSLWTASWRLIARKHLCDVVVCGVWRVLCCAMSGVGINFDKFELAEGSTLFVYSKDKKTVRGGFTAWNNKENGRFAVMPVTGDTLVVEVQTPAAAAAPMVVVGSIVHHYHPTRMIGLLPAAITEHRARRGFGDSGSCNVNSVCPSVTSTLLTCRCISFSLLDFNASPPSASQHRHLPLLLTPRFCIAGLGLADEVQFADA
jgi:hypothetical protein